MKPESGMEHDPQLAALYRAGADAAPPAHLDDAIRAAARREVAAGPRRAGIRRWTVPVSLAAVIVLSVSVVTMMREQGADRLESMVLPPVETAPPAPAATRQEEARPPAIAVPEMSKKPTKPETPAPRRSPAPPLAAPAPAEPVAPAPQVYAPPAAAMERGAAAAGSESRAKAAADMAREESAARRDSAAPRPLLRSVPAPMAADAASAGVAAQSAVPAGSLLWQDLVREPPEKWLQRIAELRRAGKTVDADTLVAEFRRRFPDELMPENLR
jgi:hypothetical protein